MEPFHGLLMLYEQADHGANPAKAALWSAVSSEPAAEDLSILAHLESAHQTPCKPFKGVPL